MTEAMSCVSRALPLLFQPSKASSFSTLTSIAQHHNPQHRVRTNCAMSTNEDGELRLMQLCTKESWWRVPHLVKLNLMLLIPFFTSYIGGFDGSMLNGIQTVSHWQEGEAQLLMLRLYQITDTSIALRF
ncbi:hypothetical protein AUP68_07580 [Ilyonectria robusta]